MHALWIVVILVMVWQEQREDFGPVSVLVALLLKHKDELPGSYTWMACFESPDCPMCGFYPSSVTHLAVGRRGLELWNRSSCPNP